MPAVVSATPGEPRTGRRARPGHRTSLARSTCFSPLTPSRIRAASLRDLQAGYNYMLPNRIVVGAEADVTFPGFPNSAGISIGGASNLTSPTLGAETFSETVLASGTVRGRIGYAPGSWLFYATGGFAWTYDRLTLTQLATGAQRNAVSVAIGLRGRCRRRGPDRAALDRAARISVHRLRQQRHDVLRRRPADRFQLRSARAARRLELSVRQRCAAGADGGQSVGRPRS